MPTPTPTPSTSPRSTTLGRELGDQEFPTTPTATATALAFLAGHGVADGDRDRGHQLLRRRVHSGRSAAGIEVREVIRPDRRCAGCAASPTRSTPIRPPARCLAGRAGAAPKDEDVEALRALHNARKSAVKARTAAMNQIHHMLITAPDRGPREVPAAEGEAAGQARWPPAARRPGPDRSGGADRAEDPGAAPPVPHRPGRRPRAPAPRPGPDREPATAVAVAGSARTPPPSC